MPESKTLDGVNLLPLFFGDAGLEPRALYWHFPAYLEGYRRGQVWRTTPASAIRVGQHKLIEFFEGSRLELYDLESDPGESKNLAEEQPELVKRLHARLEAWRKETGAELPVAK